MWLTSDALAVEKEEGRDSVEPLMLSPVPDGHSPTLQGREACEHHRIQDSKRRQPGVWHRGAHSTSGTFPEVLIQEGMWARTGEGLLQ